jgi:hypothetical protein
MKTIPANEIPLDHKDPSESRSILFEQMRREDSPRTSTFTELSVSVTDKYQVQLEVSVHRFTQEINGFLTLTHEQTERLVEVLKATLKDAKEREASYAEYAASQEAARERV